MKILNVTAVGSDYAYKWPSGETEAYPHWIEYRAITPEGEHNVRIGYGTRLTYGKARPRVVIWIDKHPHAEFVGADDYSNSGDLLCEVKIREAKGEHLCRYPDEAVPERFSGLPIVGLPTRVSGPGVHKAWAVVVNNSDHRVMITLAALRRLERKR